ncbi:MAG TPA: DUF1320 domain-containing protein, partial [Myxococcota bacterium]|nr:DUF1320 domain-containing protein [Myxococcota bacterium]
MAGVYINQAYLEKSLVSPTDLVGLTQEDVGVDTVDTDVLNEVILEAEAEVDGYLGARYSLPLATVPSLVKSLAGRICRFKLYDRRGRAGEEQQKDYDRALKLLKDLSSGTVTLGKQPEPSENPERLVRSSGGDRQFS